MNVDSVSSDENINQIGCKFALVGPELKLQKNVILELNENGTILKITPNANIKRRSANVSFPHHLIIPKLINSHIHLGDSALKDQAFNLSLDEAVGKTGLKYQVNSYSKSERIAAMKNSIKEMIYSGTSTCLDFREGGIEGIKELIVAKENLPINIQCFGRFNNSKILIDEISLYNGLGLSTPIDYTLKEMEKLKLISQENNLAIATHIGENEMVISEATNQFGDSDLNIALNYLDPKILVHLIVTSEADRKKIPKSKFLVFCPRANAYFGLGFPPVDYFVQAGYKIGLGTDNVMITSPNIIEELKWTLLRLREKKLFLDPIEALKMITINPAFNLNINSGCLYPNFSGDALIVNLKTARTNFSEDPIKNLLFRAQFPSDIDMNLFHGKQIGNEEIACK
ncbi:MAG: hypothetical protein EAX86_07270 [Candidatus Heimdallarchaeota archaeon]|nr:hypothetical protein [Candidatus Heimdallarchaeota archaeon]